MFFRNLEKIDTDNNYARLCARYEMKNRINERG